MRARIAPAILILLGAGFGGTALFANQIGLDHNAAWGSTRKLLLILGASLLLFGIAKSSWRGLQRRLPHTMRPTPAPETHADRRSHPRAVELLSVSRAAWPYISAGLAAALVVVTYVWFVSVGYWTWWPKTTYTYDLLATAFKDGHIALEEVPDPALLALEDPYDPKSRQGIQVLWDASLYGGRYYLYWGPVPGLILAGIKLFYTYEIPDQYLVFAFVLGIFVFSTLLLQSLWLRFFKPDIPAGAVFLSVLVIGLINPAPWLLSRPAGYEAAIAGGQLFFIAGLYFASISLLRQYPTALGLMLAGTSWSLAVGSRASTAIPIACLALVALVWLRRRSLGSSQYLGISAGLFAPLVLGAFALAWYNWARFGSILEFGLRYQLTVINLHQFYEQAFSIKYVAANLYNYLLNPVRIGRIFPFVAPLPPGMMPVGSETATAPEEIEAITGILVGSPFVIFAAVSVRRWMRNVVVHRSNDGAGQQQLESRSIDWVYLCLTACSILSFSFLLLYFYPTMRQLEDLVPALTILAVLGFWEGLSYTRRHAFGYAAWAALAGGLAAVSIAVSCLLAVTSYDNRFLHLNRALLRELIRFFGR